MEKIKTDLRTMQKHEALKRLEILKEKGLLKNVVDDFKKNNLIYYSEQTKLGRNFILLYAIEWSR